MKFLRSFRILLILAFLAACGRVASSPTPFPITAAVTPAPDAQAFMRAYLDAFMVEDYVHMYAILSSSSQSQMTVDDFTKRYQDDLDAMSVNKMEYSIQSVLTNPDSAQVAFHITYHTTLFSDIQRDGVVANLSLENGAWRLQWHDHLILPELADGSKLVSDRQAPSRGDIYDSNGNAVVTQSDAVELGVVAGQIPSDKQRDLFIELWRLTGVSVADIQSEYDSYNNNGQYVPIGEASKADVNARIGVLSSYSGLKMTAYTSRFASLTSQAVGYTHPIYKADVNTYLRMGYSIGQRVGGSGIEKWGEQYLAGRDEATLYTVDPSGKVGNTIAHVDGQAADAITLTIDKSLQQQAQLAMDGLPGAIVVLERDTGRVLAMVSSPGLDANLFDSNNTPNNTNLTNVLNGPDQPLLNRATMSKIPLGSVFKVVTISAALESGLFTPESTWDCQYTYTEIPGHTLYDWTWSDCQTYQQKNPGKKCSSSSTLPSGLLTLPEGLMRSCDPWFYHIGFTLYNAGKGNAISDMAGSFGLGKPTGIGIEEEPGNIPVPSDGLNATSLAIGQGNTQVNPLQVADFIAAIGNGGTLYKPQLVEKIQPAVGDPMDVFKPEANGTLPVSSDNLKVIQDAMRQVAVNPKGTGYYTLGAFSIPVAAKTGTAESGVANPHAWFAGYSLANIPGKPDIAVAVVVDNQGEGATWAAPILRRVMEIYFYGKPQSTYPWEATFGIIAQTPTPTPTP